MPLNKEIVPVDKNLPWGLSSADPFFFQFCLCFEISKFSARSTRTEKYKDCISAEGLDTPAQDYPP